MGQKVNGNSEAVKSLNFYLKTFEQRIYDTYHELMKDKGHITCELLKNKLLGKEVRRRMGKWSTFLTVCKYSFFNWNLHLPTETELGSAEEQPERDRLADEI